MSKGLAGAMARSGAVTWPDAATATPGGIDGDQAAADFSPLPGMAASPSFMASQTDIATLDAPSTRDQKKRAA
ncbi:hypothetical protein [Frateuria terrea]|uniref:hypothetical protein n=1 Tax=Frateuria terrea TaxID=529704 RepID=UPI00111358D2|nr:hypothetical protein [Frateuria terrea]